MAATELPAEEAWWVYAVAGIISIAFGMALILWPQITLGALILLFGVYAIIDGIVRLFAMFRAIGTHTPWWPHLVIAIIDIVVGLVVLAYPRETAVFLLYVIAFWAIFAGVTEMIASLALGKFLLMIVGILSTVFGFVLLGNPTAGALALVIVIGMFSIVRGIVLLLFALRVPMMPATPA